MEVILPYLPEIISALFGFGGGYGIKSYLVSKDIGSSNIVNQEKSEVSEGGVQAGRDANVER
jgi:hypothetical protein